MENAEFSCEFLKRKKSPAVTDQSKSINSHFSVIQYVDLCLTGLKNEQIKIFFPGKNFLVRKA